MNVLPPTIKNGATTSTEKNKLNLQLNNVGTAAIAAAGANNPQELKVNILCPETTKINKDWNMIKKFKLENHYIKLNVC